MNRVYSSPLDSRKARETLVRRLFPEGLPPLWCPLLTHFSARGVLDRQRIATHLRTLVPHVRGILVPGSTGEGWEMPDAEIQELLSVVLESARATGIRVQVGVLKADVAAMLDCLDTTVGWLKARTGAGTAEEALLASNVVGFTVCPPKGATRTADEIWQALRTVLDRGLPTALYQLPQVTQNEIPPAAVQALAAEYPNFYLFKDSSGQDRVARAGLDLGGVFLVRGAEGDYCRWPCAAGGPYDGFLLSTANVFAQQFGEMLDLMRRGKQGDAWITARKLERIVIQMFADVGGLTVGNPFTNANKALDHVLAFGAARAEKRPPPLLYSGVRLPRLLITQAVALVRYAGLLPPDGYMPPDGPAG